jgi:hypothetical protein
LVVEVGVGGGAGVCAGAGVGVEVCIGAGVEATVVGIGTTVVGAGVVGAGAVGAGTVAVGAGVAGVDEATKSLTVIFFVRRSPMISRTSTAEFAQTDAKPQWWTATTMLSDAASNGDSDGPLWVSAVCKTSFTPQGVSATMASIDAGTLSSMTLTVRFAYPNGCCKT